MEERKIVVPGETIIQGDEFLPGDGTRREQKDIVANKFGLADISDRLVRVIPLSGVYSPRRGNVIIGQVANINFKGWIIDFGGHQNGFLNVSEVYRYVAKGELREHFDYGDTVCAQIFAADENNIELSVKQRGFGKLVGGQLVTINANKVPRVIGKEGSMVNLIKSATNCIINVGQNGVIWIKAEKIEDELNAKKIIEYICENSFAVGLTEQVESYITKTMGLKINKNQVVESSRESESEQQENQNDKEN